MDFKDLPFGKTYKQNYEIYKSMCFFFESVYVKH